MHTERCGLKELGEVHLDWFESVSSKCTAASTIIPELALLFPEEGKAMRALSVFVAAKHAA